MNIDLELRQKVDSLVNLTVLKIGSLKIFTLAHPNISPDNSFDDLKESIEQLRSLGVVFLLSLEKKDNELIQKAFEISSNSYYLPVDVCDYQPPSFEQMNLCVQFFQQAQSHAKKLLHSNTALAIHCHHGLGRTGTICSALSLWEKVRVLRQCFSHVKKSDQQVTSRMKILLKRELQIAFSCKKEEGVVSVSKDVYDSICEIRDAMTLSQRTSQNAQFVETRDQVEFLNKWYEYLLSQIA